MEETVSSVAAVLGGFVLVYGLCSLIIKEKLYISEARMFYRLRDEYAKLCIDAY